MQLHLQWGREILMRALLDARQSKEVDDYAIGIIGIPSPVLMEKAALSCVSALDMQDGEKLVSICGSGNNGGDGIAIARILFNEGFETAVILTSDPEKMSEGCREQFYVAEKLGMPIYMYDDLTEEGGAEGAYEFSMSAQPAEIAAQIAGGDLDIALLPANLASNLYHKTKGGVKVIDINTLGVLYCVTGEEDVKSIEDLAGKKVLMTGQGATPEYALKYLLEAYGITDCEVEFKSEATEIAALLKNDPVQTAILPQPFVTVATKQNEALSVAFSLTDAWDALGGDSRLLTGATIVRSAFLDEHPKAVALFLKENAASAEAALSDIDGTAQLVADYGIIEKAPIAAAAIPNCSIVCITGEEMKAALEGYLAVLLAQSPEAVGGDLPAEDFYYIGE